MTTHDHLMDLRLRRPFVPFRIRMSDGRTIELKRQMGFAVGPSMMIVAQEPGPALRVRLDEVVSIEIPEPIV